jgi:RNA polymerase sigma-70 factor (ECF subfamily)
LPSLASLFLAHGAPSRPATLAAEALEPTLQALLAQAHETHPELELNDEDFVVHLARSTSAEEDLPETLRRRHAGDLYLALASAKGVPAAARQLEERVQAARAALFRVPEAEALASDVLQSLLARLLLPDGARPPRILDYTGRGPLDAWLKVAALRMLLNARRQSEHERSTAEDPLLGEPVAVDPELRYLRGRFCAEFKDALPPALASLSARDRALLRFRFVRSLSVDQICAVYGEPRSSVARWISQAEKALRRSLRKEVMRRLDISRREFDSIVRLIRSELDLSLQPHLATS